MIVIQGWASAHGVTSRFLTFNYSLAADFGNSFGFMSALFAALAAIGAWRAVQLQKIDLDTKLEDQKAQTALTIKSSFESTFFSLLTLLSNIVESTDIKPSTSSQMLAELRGKQVSSLNVHEGKDAMRRIVEMFLTDLDRSGGKEQLTVEQKWLYHYAAYKDDLGHYFRVLYHTFVFIKNSCPADPAFYTNIVRAQMSNSELMLLGFNCAFGKGKDKFKPIVEEFSLLDNIDFGDMKGIEAEFRNQFSPTAFSSELARQARLQSNQK